MLNKIIAIIIRTVVKLYPCSGVSVTKANNDKEAKLSLEVFSKKFSGWLAHCFKT